MNMEKLFKEYLGNTRTRAMGDYGIEIETETLIPYDTVTYDRWSLTSDGSLRNYGIEYVTRGPIPYKEVPEVLKEFHDKTEGYNFVDSVYPSLHVHVNMKDFTLKEFPVFMALLFLYEDVLVRYCGPDRDGNLFCLKTSQAEGGLDALMGIFGSFETLSKKEIVGHLSYIDDSRQKYSAINYASLSRFGSVELRMHGGTTDIEEIQRWIDIIEKIKRAVSKFETPKEVIDALTMVGSVNLTTQIFGEKLAKHLITDHIDDDMDNTLFYVMRIAKAINWSEFDPSEVGQGKKSPSLKDGMKTWTPNEDNMTTIHEILDPPPNETSVQQQLRGLIEEF